MRIYLAARYSRRTELCAYRETLEIHGHTVTSRWLNGDHQISDSGVPIGENGSRLVEEGECDRAAALRESFALEDYRDVASANLVISFTEEPRTTNSRGGRHVEFGIALGQLKRCWVVGPRENIFHWLENVRVFESFADVLSQLISETRTPQDAQQGQGSPDTEGIVADGDKAIHEHTS